NDFDSEWFPCELTFLAGRPILRYGYTVKILASLAALFALGMPLRLQASQVAGQVADFSTASDIVGARVTLFSADLRFFRETRSTGSGDFRFEAVGDGVYRLGVAGLSYEYQETNVSV